MLEPSFDDDDTVLQWLECSPDGLLVTCSFLHPGELWEKNDLGFQVNPVQVGYPKNVMGSIGDRRDITTSPIWVSIRV